MYGPHGIRVNAVAPGGVATGIPFPPHVSQAGSERLKPFQSQIPSVTTAEALAVSSRSCCLPTVSTSTAPFSHRTADAVQ